jgi:hypothetical protein
MAINHSPGTLLSDGGPLPPFRRLVVLIPPADLDEIKLARRLRSMMVPYKTGILLLSLVTEEGEDSLARRRLTNLAAILHDPQYSVESKTISGNRWIGKIQEILAPGDLLVCFSGHNASTWSLKSQPVGQTLAGRLPYPVFLLPSLAIKDISRQALSRRILGWMISLVIILVFLGLDARIVQDASGWIGTFLLGTAMLVEAGLIWSWNSLWN